LGLVDECKHVGAAEVLGVFAPDEGVSLFLVDDLVISYFWMAGEPFADLEFSFLLGIERCDD
jgi:hypothetical protein